MKALSLTIKQIWPMLKFLKGGSNIKVKVTSSKIIESIERLSPAHAQVIVCMIPA
jgi:hypothetical protein